MEIQDDGIGFDPSKLKAHNGNGLASMRERAKAIDASITVESQEGQGTRISLVKK
jgi:signal transduction histidine kinase